MNNEKMMFSRSMYWRRVRRLTGLLLALWFGATFLIIFFARELSGFSVFGWPFSFYMAAQGLTLLYLLILFTYVRRMRRLDKAFKSEIGNVQ